MSINTQIKIFSILLLMLFLDIFLNSLVSNHFFTFSLFFVNLFLLGRKYFSNKLIFLLMITGLFYESIFSTNFIGIFTASVLLVVVLSNITIFFLRQWKALFMTHSVHEKCVGIQALLLNLLKKFFSIGIVRIHYHTLIQYE